MSVIDEIAAERERQQTHEGFLPHMDDAGAKRGQLALAAASYAMLAGTVCGYPNLSGDAYRSAPQPKPMWPWRPSWWKPKDPRRDLIRAAALIVAEIERLDRAASPPRVVADE